MNDEWVIEIIKKLFEESSKKDDGSIRADLVAEYVLQITEIAERAAVLYLDS